MRLSIFFFIATELFIVNTSFSQTTRLKDLFSDIEQAGRMLPASDKNGYLAKSTLNEFDSYMFLPKGNRSDTFETISFIKNDEVKGALFAGKGYRYYNTLRLTVNNPVLPKSAHATKKNGIIDRAEFIIGNTTIEVGDNNGDNLIDFVSYPMGQGLYSILQVAPKDSIKGCLVFNALTQQYVGMMTFKIVESNNYFKDCFVKAAGVWSRFDISGEAPVLQSTVNEIDLLKKMQLPYSSIKPNKLIPADSIVLSSQEEKFIRLFKTTYNLTRDNWLRDSKKIPLNDVIGLTFPKLVVAPKLGVKK